MAFSRVNSLFLFLIFFFEEGKISSKLQLCYEHDNEDHSHKSESVFVVIEKNNNKISPSIFHPLTAFKLDVNRKIESRERGRRERINLFMFSHSLMVTIFFQIMTLYEVIESGQKQLEIRKKNRQLMCEVNLIIFSAIHPSLHTHMTVLITR